MAFEYDNKPLPLPSVQDGGATLRPAEAAAALGVSLSTVWRMVRRKELPSVKVGKRRLIPADAISQVGKPDGLPRLTADHPIWALAGAGRSGGAGPGSNDKYFHLFGPRRRK